MSRAGLWLGCLLLALPGSVMGEGPPRLKPPEAMLAKECLGYLRLDGMAQHRAAFDQTALAHILRNDTGQFLLHLAELIQDEIGPGTVKDRLLSGLPPDQLMKIHSASTRLPQVANYLYEHGVVVGFEYVSLLPPEFQLTIICPNGAQTGHREAIFGAFHLIAALNDFKIVESQVAGRTISAADLDGLHWRWWQEGQHVISTIGNAAPDHTIGVIEGKRANLTSSELFQSALQTVSYETYLRGFVDAERSLRLVKLLGKEAEKLVDELGLFGLKSIGIHMGCAGKQTRTTLAFHTTPERKGLLKLLSAPADFPLAPMPALPPDAGSVTALHLDLGQAYDTIRQALMSAWKDDKEVEKVFTSLDQALGVNLRDDLLSAFGSRVVLYNSSGEGFLGSGIGLALQVKDEQKLRTSMAAIMASAPSALEGSVRLASREVNGVTVHTMYTDERRGFGLAMAPSYTIHDGWLVLGLFPQTPLGYVHRCSGQLQKWRPSTQLTDILAEVKKEPGAKVLAMSESDPRPTLRDLSSLGPFFFAQLGAFGETRIDPALVPQFQRLTEPLFSNIGFIVDDGKAIRFETYSSVGIPFDPLGMHPYWFGLIFAANF
jgi:hypothetical protein